MNINTIILNKLLIKIFNDVNLEVLRSLLQLIQIAEMILEFPKRMGFLYHKCSEMSLSV